MFDLIQMKAEADAQDPYLTPVVGLLGTVIVAAITTLGVVYRRKQDRQDAVSDREAAKGLSEKDEIAEIDRARAEVLRYYDLYIAARIMLENVQSALRHLVRLIRDERPDYNFSHEVVNALEAIPPTIDHNK